MRVPPTPPLTPPHRQGLDDPRITPEMREAAKNLEAVFTSEMLKAMRSTVEESEFSLNNSATEIYQGMLDQEFADLSASKNSLGLSGEIIDYLLRSLPADQYTKTRNSQGSNAVKPTAATRTGGTNEGQSKSGIDSE